MNGAFFDIQLTRLIEIVEAVFWNAVESKPSKCVQYSRKGWMVFFQQLQSNKVCNRSSR